ncbi:MAG: sigma-70 family RNA polymerase sigma factor [bacterium]
MEQTATEAPEEHVARLVEAARAGSMAAFDELIRLFQTRIFNLAYRMVNNREDAGDLTQEIFVKLYRSLNKFRGQSRFSTWLYAVAANHCRSGLRKSRRIGFFESRSLDEPLDAAEGDARHAVEPVDPGASPATSLEHRELGARIGAVVAGLPEDLRSVLVLRDMQGLEYEELARVLNCSLGTVKSRLWRARFRVKEALERKQADAL